MAQGVPADPAEPRAPTETLECAPGRVVRDRAAAGRGKEEAGPALGVGEARQQVSANRDAPNPVVFRWTDDPGEDGAGHRDEPVLQVDVLPAQGQELSDAQTGAERGQDEDEPKGLPGGGLQ